MARFFCNECEIFPPSSSHMIITVHYLECINCCIWSKSNNIDEWKMFYGGTIYHEINTKCISLLNKIFSICIWIPVRVGFKWVPDNFVYDLWVVLNTSTPSKTNIPSEPFTFSNTKIKFLCMCKIGSIHIKRICVIYVQQVLSHKTGWWELKIWFSVT